MIAVDTNILVYAHRRDMAQHDAAIAALKTLIASGRGWAVAWSSLHEFIATVTKPRYLNPPSTTQEAFTQVQVWCESPHFVLLSETANHLDKLAELARPLRDVGPRIHDARIAAICICHGVSELWTADRDFSWFPQLKTRNPLVRR